MKDLSRNRWVLIQRYVTGRATSEERLAMEEWMSRDSEHRKVVREIEEIWKLAPRDEFDVNVEGAWQQFRDQKMKPKPYRELKLHYPARRFSDTHLHLFRAAAFILVALVAGFFFHYVGEMAAEPDVAERPGFYTMQELVTERGEKARVTFSDGTQVILNSASSLRFPQEFQGSAREVHLKGEAYFNVVHDPDHPFIVYAAEAHVEVLGTEFNVRGWSEDNSVDVVVREGAVSVKSADQNLASNSQVILTEGHYTNVRSGHPPLPAETVDVRNHMLWTSGGMYFDNVPFDQVIRDIERRFNAEITVSGDEMMNVPYTGTFQNANMDEVLSVISATLGIEYSRVGSEIDFHIEQEKSI